MEGEWIDPCSNHRAVYKGRRRRAPTMSRNDGVRPPIKSSTSSSPKVLEPRR
jgi:hypothetical protein